ncbi:MAG: aminopeptidase P N-terminal domain-containing protein [Candidatus Saccharimonas sp.]
MFERNRHRLFDSMGGALIILTAYDLMQSSGDMEATFLQESSFWWLTGIEEAGWKVILDGTRQRTTLVRPKRDWITEAFGGGASDAEILALSGANEIIEMQEFEPRLRQLHRKHSTVYSLAEQRAHGMVLNPANKNLKLILKRIFDSTQECSQQIHRLRAIKQPDEIAAIERATNLTVEAFLHVGAHLAEYKNECEIDAEFTYRFRRAAAIHAFQPVVASGVRASTIHYFANNHKIAARDAIVIDVGARVDGYSADVARTYCRNPTKRQRAVHAAIVSVSEQCIELIQPGASVAEYLHKSDEIMKQALHGLGLLDDVTDDDRYRAYFPHAIGHGLGVDLHDSLGGPRVFEPGMILTVEPGIYIPDEGIGMRIEDTILVTETSNRNLSGKLPTLIN